MNMYRVMRNDKKVGLYASKSYADLVVELNQKRDLRELDSESVRKVRYSVIAEYIA